MNDLNPMQYQFQTMNLPTSQTEASTTTGSNSSSAASPEDVFGEILQEAVTGATKAIATVASRRVAKFVEGRNRLQFLAQAAGWTPSSSGTSSTSSASGSSSTGTTGGTSNVNTNDPVYRLITAWGNMIAQNLQADSGDSQDTTATAGATDQNTTGTDTTDATGTDTTDDGTDTTDDTTQQQDTDDTQTS